MTAKPTDRVDAGQYTAFDGLPPLHARETALPRIHPYDDVVPGRYITPGSGQLAIEKATGAHHRITLDHLGCDAQTTADKEDAFKRLALAAEGQSSWPAATRSRSPSATSAAASRPGPTGPRPPRSSAHCSPSNWANSGPQPPRS